MDAGTGFHVNQVMWILPSLVLILVIVSIPHGLQVLAYRRWYKNLDLDQHLAVYLELYAAVNGFALSRAARQARDAMEYVYGGGAGLS